MNIILPTQHTGRVVANEKLTPKIFWLKVAPTDEITYVAGQYASFLIDGQRRPLSYATPDTTANLEFIVDIAPGGVASHYVEKLVVGDMITFLTPYGRFTISTPTTRPLLFVAAGSGIGPIRAQIWQQLSTDATTPVTLIFGNRSPEYMFFLEEFTQLAQVHANFTFLPAVSEVAPPSWSGERGLVTDVLQQHIQAVTTYDVYVCGGPAMVKATRELLLQQGLPKEQLHVEQFI